jgi:hypothetical protein
MMVQGERVSIIQVSIKHVLRMSRVSSNSATIEATKFVGPHKSRIHQYIIDTCGDYHLWSFEHENRSLLTYPFGILYFSLTAPPSLILCHIPKAKAINHIEPPSRERALS